MFSKDEVAPTPKVVMRLISVVVEVVVGQELHRELPRYHLPSYGFQKLPEGLRCGISRQVCHGLLTNKTTVGL